MTKYPGVPAPPPAYKGATVQYNNLTPVEKAKVQAQVQQAMASVNLRLKQVQAGIVVHQHSPSHVGLGAMQGTIVYPERKQPQDGVIRMVTSATLQKMAVGGVLVYEAAGIFIGAVGGAMGVAFGWVGLAFLIPIVVVMCATHWYLNFHFNQSRAKADLLDWPEQK